MDKLEKKNTVVRRKTTMEARDNYWKLNILQKWRAEEQTQPWFDRKERNGNPIPWVDKKDDLQAPHIVAHSSW